MSNDKQYGSGKDLSFVRDAMNGVIDRLKAEERTLKDADRKVINDAIKQLEASADQFLERFCNPTWFMRPK
jgi:hypothetical protein